MRKSAAALPKPTLSQKEFFFQDLSSYMMAKKKQTNKNTDNVKLN